MHAKQFSQFKRHSISIACASLLGASSASAAIHTISSSNFTMLDDSNGIQGGSTDVSGTFDDSKICAVESCTMVNGMNLASAQKFFGHFWTAHDIRVFGTGNYTFDSDCTPAQITAGTTACGDGPYFNLVVGPNQLGAHMLFDWNTNSNIDVVVQWSLNDAFNDPIFVGVPPIHSGADVWNLVSRDGSGAAGLTPQPDGVKGYLMIDGPFIDSNANFNLNMTPPFAFNVAPVASESSAATAIGLATTWTPNVSDPDSGPSALTCSIVSQPPGGVEGAATVASDCSTGTYDPELFVGASTSFTYKANDGGLDSNTATVNVTISANPPPVAGDTTLAVIGTTSGLVNLAPFITDGNGDEDLSTLTVSTPAAGGTAEGPADNLTVADGFAEYTADSGFSGVDSFGYTVDDVVSTSNEGTVTVTVQADGPSSSTPGYAAGALAGGLGSPDGSGLGTTYGSIGDVGTDAEMEQQCIGGCWDFEILNPGLLTGDSVQVVIPLEVGIPDTAVIRKETGAVWENFDSSGANDSFATAPAVDVGPPLVCPEAGSTNYVAGLAVGNRCLQLTIENDGVNDSNMASTIVADPGGIGVPLPPTAPPTSIGSPDNGGCSLSPDAIDPAKRADWTLMAGVLSVLGFFSLRRRRKQKR